MPHLSDFLIESDSGNQWKIPEHFNIGMACTQQQVDAGNGDKTAFILEDAATGTFSFSFNQLNDISYAFANLLAEHGVAQGDRVLIRLPNSLMYPTAFFGSLKLGAIAVPTSTLLAADEVAYLVQDSGAKVIVADKSMWPILSPALVDCPNLTTVLLTGKNDANQSFTSNKFNIVDLDSVLDQQSVAMKEVSTKAHDPAYLVYTSGTTGYPKGVLHGHRALLGRLPASKYWFDLHEDERILHSGKFNWTYVLGSALMDPLFHGKTVVVYEGPNDAKRWLELIKEHNCTTFIGVPTIYRQIIQKTSLSKSDVPSLRHCMSAGEHLSDEMLLAWRKRFEQDVYEAIGMSEISYYISQNKNNPTRPGAAGFFQPGHDVQLLDEEGQPVPAGEEGMICIPESDPGLFIEYWQLPDVTAKAKHDGYFFTGDYARMDEDGYIWFIGRKDDIINTFGYRVSPYEVERVIKTHPAVADCVALGEDVGPDKTIVSLCVIANPGSKLEEDELLKFGATHLAKYKAPKTVRIMDDFPRTKNGKVLRKELLAQLAQSNIKNKLSDSKIMSEINANSSYRPRRTMLYVPAHIERHIEKSKGLDADSLIFDQQESVPPHLKDDARNNLIKHLSSNDFGYSEKIVRVNTYQSPWWQEDINAVTTLNIDAVLFPRVETAQQLEEMLYHLDQAGGQHLDVMVNIESPLGVLNAQEIAACSERVSVIIMGTTDLANELKLNVTQDRTGLLTSLSLVIIAGRAYRKCVIDGPHFDLKDIQACEYSCRQARDLGFDGKAVIHPVQLNYTNDAFTPKRSEVNKAKRIIEAIEDANKNDRSMAVIDDRLIEPSLAEWASRIISIYDTVHKIGQSELLGPER
ncbi:MAG: aldolase/citrate lyase family protein [Kangiellaceae bacterium]|jgi:acyl-coenzyme A synthetase/AMP-(fatty) acid ligase/citrate lyase beta subunit|nr:aldolase/citrate lyase family protein [Kangiellaceae bacterium]